MKNKLFKTAIAATALLSFVSVAHAQASNSLWKVLNSVLQPVLNTYSLKIPQLGGHGVRCTQVDNTGLFSVASAACGSGGGGSGVGTSTNPFMATYYVATSTTATSTFNGAVSVGQNIGFNSSLLQVNGYNYAAIFTTPDDPYSVSTGFLNTLANAAQMIFRGDDSLVSSMRNGDIQYKEVDDSILAEADAYHTASSDDYQAMLDSAQYDIRSGGNINFLTGGTPTNVGYSLGTLRATIDRTGNFGIGTSSPWRRLSVNGSSDLGTNALAGYFTSTSTTASVFPYASTTALSATTLCLTGDSCRTTWPVGSGSVYPFTSTTNYGATNQATTGIAFFQNGMNASSTSHFVNASTSQTSANVVYSPTFIFGKDANGNNEQITSAADRIRIEAEGQDAFIELNPLNGDVYTQCCDFTADGLMHGIVDGDDGSTFILHVPGGNIKHGTLTKTVNYTASVGDDIIFVNGLTKTITLPTAVGNIGHSFLVKLVTSSTSTVNTTSSQTIDGSLTYPLTELNKYVQVVSNGANWWVIGDNSSLLGASASAGYFTATSTTASALAYASTTAISSSNLTSGNCVQASTGGLLTTTGSACGSGGGGTYSFTPTTNYGATNQATTGIAWFQNGVNASSTSNLVNASTTQLSSNLLYLTGATNATVGLIDDSNYTYWGTASRNGSIRYQFNHDANGGEFQMRASHSMAFVPGDDQIYDGHVQMGYAGPSYTPWTIHDNGAADREIISMSISGGTNYQAGDVIAIQGGTSNGCSVTLGGSQVSGGVIINFSSGNAYHKLSGCGGNGVAGAGGYSVGATTASNAHGGTPATVSITEVADVRPSNKLNFDSKINVGGESQNLFSVSQHSEGDSATGIGKFIWGCWDGGFSGASWGDETANKGYGTPCLTLTSSSTLTAGLFIASSTSASIFPYASTTAISANTVYAANFVDTAFSGNNCVGESSGIIGQATNCVSSLASAGGTLTISSPTGNVDASLNLAHGNVWTAITGFTAGFYTSASSTLQGTTTLTGNVGFTIASTTSAATQTVNWQNGITQRFLLTGATNFAINSTSSSPIDGGKYILKLCQDGTGSRAVSFITPGQMRWSLGTTTVASGANQCTWIGMIYDAYYSTYTVLASTTAQAQ